MNVWIKPLIPSPHLEEILANDGWELLVESDHAIFANHPEVPDEPTARSRLDRLGLLTSRRHRIEFERLRPSLDLHFGRAGL
jgi:hypothetical protein